MVGRRGDCLFVDVELMSPFTGIEVFAASDLDLQISCFPGKSWPGPCPGLGEVVLG